MVQSIESPIAWNFGQEKQRTWAAKFWDYAEHKRGRREAIVLGWNSFIFLNIYGVINLKKRHINIKVYKLYIKRC